MMSEDNQNQNEELPVIHDGCPRGPLKYACVHMHEQENKEKGIFYSKEHIMQGTRLGV